MSADSTNTPPDAPPAKLKSQWATMSAWQRVACLCSALCVACMLGLRPLVRSTDPTTAVLAWATRATDGLDPWGRPLYSVADSDGNIYTLASCGPNGASGDSDDVQIPLDAPPPHVWLVGWSQEVFGSLALLLVWCVVVASFVARRRPGSTKVEVARSLLLTGVPIVLAGLGWLLFARLIRVSPSASGAVKEWTKLIGDQVYVPAPVAVLGSVGLFGFLVVLWWRLRRSRAERADLSQ